MTDSSAFGFGKFIPGFDFLQNLGQAGQSKAGMPPFAHWVAPTVSVEEIEKRIEELKAVQFWLDQNGRALAATVQALEVQKMTLSTLKGMNVNLSDVAHAFPFSAVANAAASHLSDWPMSAAAQPAASPSQTASAAAPKAEPSQPAECASDTSGQGQAGQAANMGQAMQWWGALTQQFQHIAQQAMQDPAQQQALLQATLMGSEFAQKAVQTAGDMVRQAAAQAPSHAAATAPSQSSKSPRAAATKKTSDKPASTRRASAQKTVLTDKKPSAQMDKAPRTSAKKPSTATTKSR